MADQCYKISHPSSVILHFPEGEPIVDEDKKGNCAVGTGTTLNNLSPRLRIILCVGGWVHELRPPNGVSSALRSLLGYLSVSHEPTCGKKFHKIQPNQKDQHVCHPSSMSSADRRFRKTSCRHHSPSAAFFSPAMHLQTNNRRVNPSQASGLISNPITIRQRVTTTSPQRTREAPREACLEHSSGSEPKWIWRPLSNAITDSSARSTIRGRSGSPAEIAWSLDITSTESLSTEGESCTGSVVKILVNPVDLPVISKIRSTILITAFRHCPSVTDSILLTSDTVKTLSRTRHHCKASCSVTVPWTWISIQDNNPDLSSNEFTA